MEVLSGKTLAQIIDADTSQRKIKGDLVILQASNDAATALWVKQKKAKAEALGTKCSLIQFDAQAEAEQIMQKIQELNHDPSTAGILLQLPLYPKLEQERQLIINTILPDKDIDGLSTVNQGRLLTGQVGQLPATVRAVWELIKFSSLGDQYQLLAPLDLAGKHVVIISHSQLVGRPLSQLLLNHNATVTTCHKLSHNLSQYTKMADILVTAVGSAGLIQANMLKQGAIVIDVGIAIQNDKVVGDLFVDDSLLAMDGKYTPVPGGVGPVTVSCLFNSLAN